MSRARDIVPVLRRAAASLLAVCVLLGPAGLGGTPAFAAAARACGASCPCDEDGGEAHVEDGAERRGHVGDDDPSQLEAAAGDGEPAADSEHAAGSEPAGADPSEDACPDDCPSCGCGFGVALAVVPLGLPTALRSFRAAHGLARRDAPASGAGSGVFRPPKG
jgi:hypothetical protein